MEDKNVPVVEVKDLVVHYETYDGVVEAVNGVSFKIEKKDVLGLVGETGAGKTTIALSLMQLLPHPPAHIIKGSIKLGGEEIVLPDDATKAERKQLEKRMKEYRGKKISMIFQDPMTALNPVQPIGDQICEVIALHENCSKSEAEKKATEMLEMVGIRPERYRDYPHQMSGGMKQRVVIAIALACSPELLIADEPTTALDVTIQAQVLNLLQDLQKDLGLTYMFITHDMSVVKHISDDIIVMYLGQIVEKSPAKELFTKQYHPYTQALLSAIPVPSLHNRREKIVIKGELSSPINPENRCRFAGRCAYCTEGCKTKPAPKLVEVSPNHFVACHRSAELVDKLNKNN